MQEYYKQKKLWNTKLKLEMIGLELLIKIIEKTK